MEYRLTLDTLTIGSLAVCLTILATAWILDLFGRLRRRPRYGMDHDDNTPGSEGRRSSDRESRLRPRTDAVEASMGTNRRTSPWAASAAARPDRRRGIEAPCTIMGTNL
jgi:hypothetical protein